MTKPATQAERLTRIETLLEQAVIQRTEERERYAEERKLLTETINSIAADLKDIRAELKEDKDDLAALKNKGAGLLVGVGIVGSCIGAAGSQVIEWFK